MLQSASKIPEIGIDVRFLSSGLGTYALNILKNLDPEQVRIRAVVGPGHVDELRPYCDSVKVVEAGMYSASEQFSVAKAASGCDLFHATHYNAPLLYRGKLLVTVHDVIHLQDLTLKGTVKSLCYARPVMKLVSSRAARIITVSEYSKRNLVNFLNVPEGKISVIPNGVSEEFYPEARATARDVVQHLLRFDNPYLVYIGNLKPHKNVDGLLRAFKLLCDRKAHGHKLVIAGDDRAGRPALMKLASQVGVSRDVIFMGRVEQCHVRQLYCGATMVVLPSFEEGFGLPILEAMACGIPVACSRAAAMPEVGGDAVQYFDPGSPESISDCIERVLSSGELRAELARRGVERVRKYTWQASAQAHLALYKALTN